MFGRVDERETEVRAWGARHQDRAGGATIGCVTLDEMHPVAARGRPPGQLRTISSA
jgi:hypothetical protein